MNVEQLLQNAQVVVGAEDRKRAVLLDWETWEELLVFLEDLEDAEEIGRLRELDEQTVAWADAKAEVDETAYLLRSEANKERLFEAIPVDQKFLSPSPNNSHKFYLSCSLFSLSLS